jgi:hypothetical protein
MNGTGKAKDPLLPLLPREENLSLAAVQQPIADFFLGVGAQGTNSLPGRRQGVRQGSFSADTPQLKPPLEHVFGTYYSRASR